MTPSHIAGRTRTFGAPRDWIEDLDGPCVGLPIRDEIDVQTGNNVMYSLHMLTTEEKEILLGGGMIKLGIMGTVHPVIRMEVVP